MPRFFVLYLLLSFPLLSEPLDQKFPKGKGSRFTLKMEGAPAEVSVTIADSSANSVNVEYYLSGVKFGLRVELWQQFKLVKKNGERLRILEGYHQAAGWNAPEKIDPDLLAGLEAMGLGDFLLSESDDLQKLKVGEEEIELPAGKTKALHLRQSRDGSTVDYWVSAEAGPISLVQLKSVGKMNYTLVLDSLLSNVARKIDPSKTLPPSAKGRELFHLPVRMPYFP